MSNILYHSLNVSFEMSFMIVSGDCHAFEWRDQLCVCIPCVDGCGNHLEAIALLDDEYGMDPEIGSLIAVEHNGYWVYIPDSSLTPMERAVKGMYEQSMREKGQIAMLLSGPTGEYLRLEDNGHE